MKAALDKAGIDTAGSSLYAMAVKHLQRASGNPFTALDSFTEECAKGADLAVALIGRKAFRDRALEYLRQTAADMRPQSSVGDGQKFFATQTSHAASDAPPSGGAGQGVTGTQNIGARPAAPPVAYLDAARGGSRRLANSLLDSFKVRDGRSIGDVRWNELERLANKSRIEAEVLNRLRKRGVPLDPTAKVRDLVTDEELTDIVQAVRYE